MVIKETAPNQFQPHIYRVSELNQNIKQLLEDKFPFIWISGEISNFRIPSSGHCYFTLKDAHSQIGAVMFRSQAASLKFRPENGLSVIGLGRISVYEPRGSYQVILEYMDPKGIGGLQIAFDRLKQKLSAEGLFDAAQKMQLPLLPKKISIVTSPSGAAVRDFINVAQRRFPNLPLEIFAVSVQGDRAPVEIINALNRLNENADTDIIVVARGGGSIEDLWAFNDEQVARAIFASRIPVISAVGHETDFTIADFVADLRAPTPSAAAEIAVPSKTELKKQLIEFNQKLYQSVNNNIKILKKNVDGISDRIIHPQRRLQDLRMRLDDYSIRLVAIIRDALERKKEQVAFRQNLLLHVTPQLTVARMQTRLDTLQDALITHMGHFLREIRTGVARSSAMLTALNPMSILERGYSITRTVPERIIVRRAEDVNVHQPLEILLGHGKLTVSVEERNTDS
jgi:exodeoxyribonuclease VII large subunit